MGMQIFCAFTGLSTSGSVSLSNANVKIGDVVQYIVRISDPADGQWSTVYFEPVITVPGEIQQTQETDLSGNVFLLVLYRSHETP